MIKKILKWCMWFFIGMIALSLVVYACSSPEERAKMEEDRQVELQQQEAEKEVKAKEKETEGAKEEAEKQVKAKQKELEEDKEEAEKKEAAKQKKLEEKEQAEIKKEMEEIRVRGEEKQRKFKEEKSHRPQRLADCQVKIQSNLKNPRSFDTEFSSIRYAPAPKSDNNIVTFKFYAQNGFGADVIHTGACVFDKNEKLIDFGAE